MLIFDFFIKSFAILTAKRLKPVKIQGSSRLGFFDCLLDEKQFTVLKF